ncbi:MAG: hypothetical protein ACLUOF_04965 [Ruminococcus sp.]
MANTQLGGAETIDSYRKKIMTILKKSGRTPVSDRDLATKCRTNRGGAANFRKAVQELAKRVRSVSGGVAMSLPQTWAIIRRPSSV